MEPRLIVVKAAYDPEARVWYVEDSDLYGLNAEASTIEELRDQLPAIIVDLLVANKETSEREIPVEIIAHTRTKVRIPAAA